MCEHTPHNEDIVKREKETAVCNHQFYFLHAVLGCTCFSESSLVQNTCTQHTPSHRLQLCISPYSLPTPILCTGTVEHHIDNL